MCYATLTPLPTWTRGERLCEKCAPRPHQVTLTFIPRLETYSIGFLAEDAKTCLGWPYKVEGDDALRQLVRRGHGDMEDLEEQLETWGQGCIDLHLTQEQYRTLVRDRRNPMMPIA